jgi:hypothetical protein
LLEKVGLLGRDFVETITLATLLDIGGGETSAKLSVEVCDDMLANLCPHRVAHLACCRNG